MAGGGCAKTKVKSKAQLRRRKREVQSKQRLVECNPDTTTPCLCRFPWDGGLWDKLIRMMMMMMNLI